MTKKSIYFDYAAATPLDPRVLKAMEEAARDWANPSSLHTPGRQAFKALEHARVRLAKALGAKPAEIIFTSGSTESANIAIQGVAHARPGSRVVVSALEHEAVRSIAAGLEASGHQTGTITVPASGIIDPEQVRQALDDITTLVCLQYANNEIGTIQPVAEVAKVVAAARRDRGKRGITTPLYLYCDAAQAGLLNLQVARLGVDLMSLGGSKLYGPAGSGALYVRSGVELVPVLYGSHQERGLRGGTADVVAAAGLAQALELAQTDRVTESKRQAALRDELWQALKQIDGIELNGAMRPRLPGNLNVMVTGVVGDTLVAHLDAAGFAAATGAACEASNDLPSSVLLAIGRTSAQANASLRITLGRPTTKAEVVSLTRALKTIIARVRELSHHNVQ